MLHTSFGSTLRHWRTKRGRTQPELANLAGYSQRHIGFLENGRSQPTRTAVVALAEALQIPLKERNTLLQAAGFAPLFGAAAINSAGLTFGTQALEALLQSHRPFPAIVVDRAWNVYAGNNNAFGLLQMYLLRPLLLGGSPFNLLELCLSHFALRPHLGNWPRFAQNTLMHLKRDLDVDDKNEALRSLIEEIKGDPEFSARASNKEMLPLAPYSTIELDRDGRTIQLLTVTSQIADPADATLEALFVKTFLPANDATRSALIAIDAHVTAEVTMDQGTQGSGIRWLHARSVD